MRGAEGPFWAGEIAMASRKWVIKGGIPDNKRGRKICKLANGEQLGLTSIIYRVPAVPEILLETTYHSAKLANITSSKY